MAAACGERVRERIIDDSPWILLEVDTTIGRAGSAVFSVLV
jgi:hypothetical protein